MNKKESKIAKLLDDGSLYADHPVIEEMLQYPDMEDGHLLVSRDHKGKPTGYLPVGYYYRSGQQKRLSYIAAMPNSPAISPTYTPGATHILSRLSHAYFDCDVISDLSFIPKQATASTYGMPLERYWRFFSSSRKKDLRRKLKKAEQFNIQQGNLSDVRLAWQWMQTIWEQRGNRFGNTPYDQYLEVTLSWLNTLEQSQRANLKIDKYMLGREMVGINCCVIHRYQNRFHCDDYLTWYNPHKASGLGIISVVKNITNPAMEGFRYNLSAPGINGKIQKGHQYKWDLIPEPLRLTQSVLIIS
ncbi:MAG: hypothetical protein KAG28_02395 [Cocleimonas sp.]|nr:hypothetical protein [Cocleimonas sp.]